MRNFAGFIPAVKAILGLDDFREENGKKILSGEDRQILKDFDFPDSFVSEFESYLNAPETKNDKGEKSGREAILAAAVGKLTKQFEAKSQELEALKASSAKESEDLKATIDAKEKEIKTLGDQIAKLSDIPETDPGENAGAKTGNSAAFNAADDKLLGGMAGEFNSLDRPYNQRARQALLFAQGVNVMAAAPAETDFSTLQEDLGAFYRTPWSTRIQSMLVELPSIKDIFEEEAGHQDLDTLVNLFLGEFSQADNSSSDFQKVAKGKYDFGTETLRMYDVMFAFSFKDLKKLEKSWIGSLNREGSSSLKLSFIEYLLVETAKALHNEQQLRFVNGVRKNPKVDEPGRAMEAADGIYEYLRKRVDGYTDFTPNGGLTGKTVYQIKPFSLGKITPGNIGEVLYQGTSMIPSVYRDKGVVELYIPSYMIPWYHKYCELHYGKNTDYKGAVDYVREFPGVKIVPIPNADGHSRIFWTFKGNIKTFCLVSGEMFKFVIEQHHWSVDVHSQWKESIQAFAVGKKFTDPLDMDGSTQLIWCNEYDFNPDYFVDGNRDSNPDALLHTSIVTPANTALHTITDITNAGVGRLITVKCGADGDRGVVIKKEGKFANISAEWKPAKGDSITLMADADGNFIEISRSTAAQNSYQFPPDETTPSLMGASVFVVGKNTTATAITDFADALEGEVYTIHGDGEENASTIAKGGQFDIKSDITLKTGAFIKLVKSADGKFHEIARG